MSTRNISWEIVLAGLTFIGIGIYLFNQASSGESSNKAAVWHSEHAPHPSPPSSEPSLPGAIVIDLQNLESLKNLENLKNLKNLENFKNLEIELKNLDKVIQEHAQDTKAQENLQKNLKDLEAKLQEIEKADFKLKLQNQKLYINKDYNVDEAEWTEVNSGVYVFRESFPVSDLQSMDLNLGFGNLNIVGGNGENGEITIRATGDVGNQSIFSDQLQIHRKLNTADASFQLGSVNNSDLSSRINLEATLTLPRSIRVNAKTSGGHINANNLTNNQTFKTSGGHISLDTIEGETVAETQGGHITSDRVSGNTLLSTGGGHIKVNNSEGSLTAKTGGGHIEIKNARGEVIAKTSGGNISATITKADGPLKFFTSAGNVSLFLPHDIAANLDISGSTVELDDSFKFDGTKNKGSINGMINGGGNALVVSCGYGNVNISSQ